jgi:SAM-dependent methyltransferase
VTFDPIAPHYDHLERWFSRGLMHRARTTHLQAIPPCHNTLLLGEGPGRFLPLILKQFPEATVTCVDSSPGMLSRARHRIPDADHNRVTLLEADIRSWQPPANRFDLIATHFFLDCFREDELSRIIPCIASAATSNAHWLIADFNLPKRGIARWRAAFIIGALYRFFRFATGLSAHQLISPQPWLERSGFHLHRRVELDHRLLHSDWWRRRSGSE